MPQLHTYVSEAVAERVRRRARDRGPSVSRYLAERLTADLVEDWPAGFFEQVIGGWQGEALCRLPEGDYETREPL